MPGTCRTAVLLPLALLVSSTVPALAQSTLAGVVREDSTGAPLAGVEVVLEGSRRAILTGSTGRFVLGELTPGPRVVLFRMPGYAPLRVTVQLNLGDTTHYEARLSRSGPQQLDSVTVTGRPPTRGVGLGREAFEERRSRGFGRFIDTEEMRRSEHRKVSDLFRGMAGVRIVRFRQCEVPPNKRCTPMEERAANGRGVKSIMPRDDYCWMSVMLDGRPIYISGSNMKVPDLSRDIRVQDLDMVEVYRSAGETPGEYSGTAAACGVVLLWSKRAP